MQFIYREEKKCNRIEYVANFEQKSYVLKCLKLCCNTFNKIYSNFIRFILINNLY